MRASEYMWHVKNEQRRREAKTEREKAMTLKNTTTLTCRKEQKMKYFWISKADGSKKELTPEEAKDRLGKEYTEVVCTFEEMLSSEGVIPFRFGYIEIVER